MFHPFRRGPLAVGLLLAAVAAVALVPSARPTLAQPPGALPPELAFVPADAAVFVHANGTALWNSPVLKALRTADAKLFAEATAAAQEMFGATPESLRSATFVMPSVKGEGDVGKLAFYFTFNGAIDKAKLAAGVAKAIGKGPDGKAIPHKLLTPTPTSAVFLLGMEELPKPGPAGPLSDALRDAASGKFAAVMGMTMANLPDDIRGDNLPEFVRPYQPLFRSQAVIGTLNAAKDLTFDVRVKASSPAQAAEAEKALGALVKLIREGLGEGMKELAREKGMEDVMALLKGFDAGLSGTKFGLDKSEARATTTVRGDLPFAQAFVSGVKKVKDSADTARSSNNLKQIALAMHNYADTSNSFPPAAVCDRGGKPMLSWRVLILPYIEQDQLYKQFKLDEPWDSPNNKKLLDKMPAVYAVPGAKPGGTTTHYRVFVGNGAGFDYVSGPRFPNITDGTSNTIMVVTGADAVPWTKPEELAFDPEKDMTKLLGAVVNGKAQVAMFDGSVRSLSKIPDRKNLNGLITRAGGEVVQFDD